MRLCLLSFKGAIEKELELDTEQATKFLDEHDLHDVLNKLPDEAFDLLAGEIYLPDLSLATPLNAPSLINSFPLFARLC